MAITQECCVQSWQQHPTRHQLYGHLPPITKTIQVRQTRHAGHCWRSRDELIRDVLLWIPTHGRAKAGRPARTYIQQLCEDTGCCPEDLPRAMNEWRERVRDIRATSTIWWWWWYLTAKWRHKPTYRRRRWTHQHWGLRRSKNSNTQRIHKKIKERLITVVNVSNMNISKSRASSKTIKSPVC